MTAKTPPPISRPIVATMLVLLALLLVFTALNFHMPTLARAQKAMTDFDAFYVAGLMYWDGSLHDAYSFRTLFDAQKRFAGDESLDADSLMPWTYPPPFNLVTAALAAMPIWLSYLVFTGGTFIAYLAVLRRIAGVQTGLVLFAIFPVLALNIRSGQNGFLTGTLIGIFLLQYIRNQPSGGFALGMMIFKPHLAVGSAVLALAERRWGKILIAAGTTIGLLAISTLMFGIEIWEAFTNGVNEARQFLSLGYYPMFRMTSVYATLHTAGFGPNTCLIVQLALAVLACSAIGVAAHKGTDRRQVAALAAFASLLASPYSYDYDLTILGLAAALLMPHLLERAGRIHLVGMIALCWLATGWGLALSIVNEQAGSSSVAVAYEQSIGSLALIALALLALFTLRNSSGSSAHPDSARESKRRTNKPHNIA